MNVFEAVRESGITARQAAEHCGIKVNRNSMAVCPFHKDKNPSMKVDRRYYCVGCGEKGDAIDYVAKFYGLGKKDAALQIAAAFGISFEEKRGRKPPPKRFPVCCRNLLKVWDVRLIWFPGILWKKVLMMRC